MVPESVIADIRQRAPLADIIGEFVALKKAGHSFRGLCPFHNEKTPSFHVHPRRGFYHCFGCKASGDVFSFLMQIEGKSFPEVLQSLAERTGIELPHEEAKAQNPNVQRARAEQDRLYNVLEQAAQFYEQQLERHAHGKLAQQAYAERQLTPDTVRAFRLGYAPSEWDGLAKFLGQQDVALRDAERVGLLIPRNQGEGYYDRFRHRAMFPIRDVSGRVIAFSGRALEPVAALEEGRDPPPKYINSPEHPLFHKGEVLFGLYEARVAIRRQSTALLCEGNFDVVSLHQAGVTYAIAPLGTAFTEEHAKKIKRFAERAIVLFDADGAGKKATREAISVLRNQGVQVLVATLPDGDDPDSFARREGAEILQKLIDRASPAMAYVIDQEAQQAGGDPARKAQAIANLGRWIAEVESPVEKQLYIERIASRFSISDLQVVRRQLQQGNARNPVRSSPAPTLAVPGDTMKHIPQLERELVALFIDQPELLLKEGSADVGELLTNQDLRVMFEAILEMVQTSGNVDATRLLERFAGAPLHSWLAEQLAMQRYEIEIASELVARGISRLKQERIEASLPDLQQRIVQARKQGDDDLATDLTKEFIALRHSAHKLKQKSLD